MIKVDRFQNNCEAVVTGNDVFGLEVGDVLYTKAATNEESDLTELLSVGEQSCLVFAARYAHARKTGAANMVVNTILANWDRLIPETQAQLKREAKAEAVLNLEDWQRILDR